jgi:Kazal-type serine protease inhibitor domain
MNWILWILIAFLVLSWAQYTYPDKTEFVKNIYDPVNQQLNKVIPIEKGQLVSSCPAAYDPVCYNNMTYQNACKAGEQGILNVIQGACK